MRSRPSFFTINILFVMVLFLPMILIPVEASDAVLLNQQTNIQVRNNKLYKTESFELQINNKSGEKYAEISIPYSKLNKVSKVEAIIKDKNGIVVRKLKSSDIVDRSAMADFSFYEDNYVKEFTLIHNVYPYTICYSYQKQEDAFFYIDFWTPIINCEIPSLKASLTLEVPLDYKVAYTSQLVDSFKTDTVLNQIKYQWKASYTKQVLPELYSPDLSNFIPEVKIVPSKFKYDKEGLQNTWISYGNWEYSLIDGLNDLPETEIERIKQICSCAKNDKEKVKLLYHYLQDETRYVNISIKTGGMKPYPASYVAANKYGDCKALANYFKSVLNCIGIQSFYTNVNAGDEIKKSNLNFPSMQFNHVILCVPLQKDTVWLDCTSHCAFNYLGTFTQNREAFLIDKNNSHFTKTPALSKQDVLVTRTIQINSDLSQSIISSFHNTYKGSAYESLFDLYRSVSESRRAQIIRNNFVESNMELIDFKLIPADRDSAFIMFDYTAKADKLFKNYGNDQLIGLVPFAVPAFKEPKSRKYPVQIDFPMYKIDTLNYQIPARCVVVNLPKNQNVDTKYGTYNISFQQNKNSIEVIKSFVLNVGNYPLEQYKEFYNFVCKVFDLENNTYIVTKKQI